MPGFTYGLRVAVIGSKPLNFVKRELRSGCDDQVVIVNGCAIVEIGAAILWLQPLYTGTVKLDTVLLHRLG